MLAVINDCCAVKRMPPGAAAGAAGEAGVGGGEGRGEAVQEGPGALPGSGGGGETVFLMNGFHLHRNKSQVCWACSVHVGRRLQAIRITTERRTRTVLPCLQHAAVLRCPLRPFPRLLAPTLLCLALSTYQPQHLPHPACPTAFVPLPAVRPRPAGIHPDERLRPSGRVRRGHQVSYFVGVLQLLPSGDHNASSPTQPPT